MKGLKINAKILKRIILGIALVVALSMLALGIFTSQKKEGMKSAVAKAKGLDRSIRELTLTVKKGDEEKLYGAYQLLWQDKIAHYASDNVLEGLRLKVNDAKENNNPFKYDEATAAIDEAIVEYERIYANIKELYTPVEKPLWCDGSMDEIMRQTQDLMGKMDFNITDIYEVEDHSFVMQGFAAEPKNMNRVDDLLRLMKDGVRLLARPEILARGYKASEGVTPSGFNPRPNFLIRVYLDPLSYGGDCDRKKIDIGLKSRMLAKFITVPISTHVFRGAPLEGIDYIGAIHLGDKNRARAMLTANGTTFSAREKTHIGPRVVLERITPSKVVLQIKESLLGGDGAWVEIEMKN